MARQAGIKLSARERRSLKSFLRHSPQMIGILRTAIVLLSGSGYTGEKISRIFGISPRTVRECRRRWRRQGLLGLQETPRSGRPKTADASFIRLLIRTVEKDPRSLGYVFTRWTNPRLSEYLAQKTGVRVSPDWIGELLRTHGFVWGKSKLTTKNLANPVEKKTGREAFEGAPKGLFGG
jgi:transposase